jgi:hypothetical protein
MSAEDMQREAPEPQAPPPSEPYYVQLPDGTRIGGADTIADAVVIASAVAQLIGMATGGGVSFKQITVVDGSTQAVAAWLGTGAFP